MQYIMKESPQRRAQYFHQRGWIANHFHVKNNLNSILKTRLKKAAETIRPPPISDNTPIHFRTSQFSQSAKPFTAPNRMHPSREMGSVSHQDSEVLSRGPEGSSESSYSSFKATLSHRKPLLFMKPYSRNRTSSLTIDETKSQVYQQINNPGLNTLDQVFQKGKPIEYLTEYTEITHREEPVVMARPIHRHRASLNVLRDKLKRRGAKESKQEHLGIVGRPIEEK